MQLKVGFAAAVSVSLGGVSEMQILKLTQNLFKHKWNLKTAKGFVQISTHMKAGEAE